MALRTLLSRRWSLLWTLPALYALCLLISAALSLSTTPLLRLAPNLLLAVGLLVLSGIGLARHHDEMRLLLSLNLLLMLIPLPKPDRLGGLLFGLITLGLALSFAALTLRDWSRSARGLEQNRALPPLLGGLLQGDLAFLWPVGLGLGLALPVAAWIALPLVPSADTMTRLAGALLLLSASLLDAARIWRPSVEHIPRAITTLVMVAGAVVGLSLPWPDGVIPLPNLFAVVLVPLGLVVALGYGIIYDRRKAGKRSKARTAARS